MKNIYEKVQIKRKWGQYEAHHVNSTTPVRDKMIQWVGERRVTEEELKQYLSSIQEERGKSPDMSWFTRNDRFFEQTSHRGQDVYTLSKYGKRVLEAIKRGKAEKDKKQLNENWGAIQMKNFKTFNQFINESIVPKDVSYYYDMNQKFPNEGPFTEETDELKKELEKAFKWWPKNAFTDAYLDSHLKKEVTKIATEYIEKYKKINGNIILQMISILG